MSYMTPPVPLVRAPADEACQIPLAPNDIHEIWKALEGLEFDDTHGGFTGHDTYGDSKKRLLESAKLYVKHAGYIDHAIHDEAL